MSKTRFQPEEIIGKLRHADVLLGQGKKIADVVKTLGVSDVTYYRWRQEFGGMTTAQAKRLKELERENGQLRQIVADLTLDKRLRPEAATGTVCAPRGDADASQRSARGWGSPSGTSTRNTAGSPISRCRSKQKRSRRRQRNSWSTR